MGKLILVATPIGNLDDISTRQTAALQEADLVAAEDTRHSGLLLQHLGLKKPLLSYFQHNEEKREGRLLAELEAGRTVALISDAGTPGICDPGSAILRTAVHNGHETDAIPGPCALIQALILSGLSTERFAFEGFLPRGQALLPFLQSLRQEKRTLIFYEAPHRLQNTLQTMRQAFEPERQIAVCRELTKKFQEINRGTLAEIAELWQQRTPKGEFVLVLGGAPAEQPQAAEDIRQNARQHLERLLSGGMKHKAAAREVAAVYSLPISEVYQMGLDLKTAKQ
ncbi:MAG: 16S rRNA (cytidine(1402)-2'-O)-methyltransferase [Firmicutes bacterium]|nr:16S rRNA (cytidine(1402)-2'-O)-methyltransferase [Bacillota bacterium]